MAEIQIEASKLDAYVGKDLASKKLLELVQDVRAVILQYLSEKDLGTLTHKTTDRQESSLPKTCSLWLYS